jgi:pimeloyl-ACP methyl ester carboxylesterase
MDLMRRSPVDRRSVVAVSVIALAATALVGFVPTVIVGESLPGTPPTPAVAGTETARFDEGTIRYQQAGDGAHAILLLHGFNGHLGQWDGVWRELADCDCRRIRIDLPGFGASDWQTDAFGVSEQVERVVALLDRLGVRTVTLVGTSMGGSVAAALAARHPDRVRSLVLVAPSGYPGSLVQSGLYGRMARPGFANRAATLVARGPLFGLLYPHSRALQALTVTATYGRRWSDLLADVRAPTLIIWGRGDETTPYAYAAAVHRAIAGSELISLDAATGHLLPEQRPRLVARSVELMARGDTPQAAAAALPAGLLRPGEGAARG